MKASFMEVNMVENSCWKPKSNWLPFQEQCVLPKDVLPKDYLLQSLLRLTQFLGKSEILIPNRNQIKVVARWHRSYPQEDNGLTDLRREGLVLRAILNWKLNSAPSITNPCNWNFVVLLWPWWPPNGLWGHIWPQIGTLQPWFHMFECLSSHIIP